MQVFVFHFLSINAYKESFLHNFEFAFKMINTNKFTLSKTTRVEEITITLLLSKKRLVLTLKREKFKPISKSKSIINLKTANELSCKITINQI